MSAQTKDLVAKRGELDAITAKLDAIFDEAGDTYDMAKVTSLNGDADAKVKQIRLMNNRADTLRREVDDLAAAQGGATTMKHPGVDGEPTRKPTKQRYGRVTGIGRQFIDGVKALDGTSGGTLVHAFYDPQIEELPQRQLFIRSLIPTTPCDSDKVWFLRQTVATQNAAAVAAGGLKPTSTYTAERVETPVTTVAHVTEAIDRGILSDHEELTGFLDGQLRLGVLLQEENQIINGNGTAPNLRGILNTAGIQTQAKGADPVPDAIHKAITKIRIVFMEPDGIIIHPNDWQDIRLLKTADGTYIFGDPADTAPERIFGLQVVTSTLIAEGTALVGAFGIGAEVWDREQARVTFAETGLGNNAGEEMFSRNQIRFRGESRLAFGVKRPNAFCTVTSI